MCFQHTVFYYWSQNLHLCTVCLEARWPFRTLKLRLCQLWYHITIKLEWSLISNDSYQLERVQWSHTLFATYIDTTCRSSSLLCCIVKLRRSSSLKRFKSWITSKNRVRIVVLIHIAIATKQVEMLFIYFFTLFHTIVFCAPYFLMSSSMTFTSSLFSLSTWLNSYFNCFSDAIITFEMTSCSDSFHSKLSLNTL